MVNKNQNDKVKDALSKSDCGYELIFIFYEPGQSRYLSGCDYKTLVASPRKFSGYSLFAICHFCKDFSLCPVRRWPSDLVNSIHHSQL